jgi:hypothetical protein
MDTEPPIATSPETDGDSATGFWKRTLWFMVFVQFVMRVAQAITSPILPLFLPEFGVTTPSSVEFWSGILTSLNFLVAVFVRRIVELMTLGCAKEFRCPGYDRLDRPRIDPVRCTWLTADVPAIGGNAGERHAHTPHRNQVIRHQRDAGRQGSGPHVQAIC